MDPASIFTALSKLIAAGMAAHKSVTSPEGFDKHDLDIEQQRMQTRLLQHEDRAFFLLIEMLRGLDVRTKERLRDSASEYINSGVIRLDHRKNGYASGIAGERARHWQQAHPRARLTDP